MKKIIFLFLTLSFFVFAHKINIFSYKEGQKIFVEGYFSDGKPCKNSEIIVFDEKNNKIIEGKTDEQGIFSFNIPETSKIKIVLISDIGHKVETEMKLQEKLIERKTIRENGRIEEKQIQQNIDEEKIREIIEKEINKILKEIEKEKQRVKIHEIISAFGYILGIFGIILYLRNQNKK